MKFKKYNKTPQFRDVARNIKKQADFKGLDDNDEAIYEPSIKPVINFVGTVKLHGSNASISFDGKELKAGKRSSFISEKDLEQHFGFSRFVYVEHRKFFEDMLQRLHKSFCTKNQQITLDGEFAGKGIQKNVGISKFDKALYFFGLKVYDKETEESKWIDISNVFAEGKESNVYNIHEFPTYQVEVDFNKPDYATNEFIKLTEQVENECPVTKQLGEPNAIGEGIVWTGYWQGQRYIFKTKGDKHSAVKVKKLASVDPEVLKSIDEFVNYAVTKNRIEQGIKETGAESRTDTGKLLKWVATDILSEETDTLKVNGLEWKQVASEVNRTTKEYFFKTLDKF